MSQPKHCCLIAPHNAVPLDTELVLLHSPQRKSAQDCYSTFPAGSKLCYLTCALTQQQMNIKRIPVKIKFHTPPTPVPF